MHLAEEPPACEDGLRAQSPTGQCSSPTLLSPREGPGRASEGGIPCPHLRSAQHWAALQHHGQRWGPGPPTPGGRGGECLAGCHQPTSGSPPGVFVPAPEAFLGGALTAGSPQLLHAGSEDRYPFALLLPPIGTRLKTSLNSDSALQMSPLGISSSRSRHLLRGERGRHWW